MAANLDQTISELRSLAVDLSEVDAALADRRAVDKQLTDARRKLAGLRPNDKDYAVTMQATSQLINALEVTLAGTGDDLAAAVEAAKDAAIEQSKSLSDAQARIRSLDAAIVRKLTDAFGLIIDRHASTLAASEMFGSVANWQRERRQEVGQPGFLAAPGGETMPNTAQAAVKYYLDRFYRLAQGGTPADGEELTWFSRRRY